MRTDRPAEPWHAFLNDLDAQLTETVDLHCAGGFAVSQCYGIGRETADLDVLSVIPRNLSGHLLKLAGYESLLHKRHRVYFQRVEVANFPDSYSSRLITVFPAYQKLQLWVLEAHDLALTKLERSSDKDLQDILHLANRGYLKKDILIERYRAEMRPYLSGRTPGWHDTTLEMWIESCWSEEKDQ